MLDDVDPHAVGRRGGEGHHGHVREKIPKFGDLPILGTEIMAPLGHAVCLVDGDGGEVPRLQVLLPVVEHQALGRHVEEAELAAVESAQP